MKGQPRYVVFIMSMLMVTTANAWNWHALWQSKNHQAQHLMKSGQFEQAEQIFERDDWRATAAFRAGHYERAAHLYQKLQTADAYYNQGNALAHLQQYQQALQAYNKALALDKNHQDARYNRDIVQKLLQKQSSSSKQSSSANSKTQPQSPQNLPNQSKSQVMDQKPAAQQPSKAEPSKPNSADAPQTKKATSSPLQPQQTKPAQSKAKAIQDTQSAKSKEQQQTQAQWLKLIPDDPGGFLREKFYRDYWRKQQGE